MKKCRITVVRQTVYEDLVAQYENPIEHACDMRVGQVFIARLAATRRVVSQRVGVDVGLRDGTCARWRELLRRMDAKPSLGDDIV